MAQPFMIPGGKTKGTPLTEADENSLKYWFDRISKDLADNPEKNYADRDRMWLATAKVELVKRFGIDPSQISVPQPGRPETNGAPSNGAPKPAAPTNGAALARSSPQSSMAVVGSAYDVSAVNKMLEEAAATAHLISPATVCGSLPPGCEVSVSMVKVDPNTDKSGPGDVAPMGGGKLSLSGNVLKKIGAAAGISWDMNASGRLDDGSDPHYCHYRAVGHVKNFDGSSRVVSGEVEIDMREGSPQIDALYKRAKGETSNIDNQVRDTRLFLLRHAETKAKLRAIADMGVKRSYTAAELAKPFKVARIMFTGRSEDPQLRRMFAEKTADAMLGSATALYPHQQPAAQLRQVPQMMAAQHVPMLHAPPPINDTADYEEIDYEVPGARPTPKPANGASETSEQAAS